MEPRIRIAEAYRATIMRSLMGRPAAPLARAHGLPKDSIRNVLQGHDPRLGRADAICRALGITFLLGARAGNREKRSGNDEAHATGAASPTDRVPVHDVLLAEVLSRLVDRWETTPMRERAGLALAVTSLLDVAGARDSAALGRTIESLAYRTVEEPATPDTGGSH